MNGPERFLIDLFQEFIDAVGGCTSSVDDLWQNSLFTSGPSGRRHSLLRKSSSILAGTFRGISRDDVEAKPVGTSHAEF